MPFSKIDVQNAVNALQKHSTKAAAARALGIPTTTLKDRLAVALSAGILPTTERQLSPAETIKRLEKELKAAQQESADAAQVKHLIRTILGGAKEQQPPKWLEKSYDAVSAPGVPTLFLSDLHWGEKVHPTQIGGVNEYNTQLAHERLRKAIDVAIHLMRILDRDMRYPGIVIPLGGDMVSGDIHEELAESNEMHTIPTVLDMEKQLAALIKLAADTFGRVFLPCVTGNHGRNTKKIRAKDRHHTSFDWLLYKLLEARFAGDKRVTFFIPDGPDAYYSIYGVRYLLTHGDQFRGGDGMIGALGPIIRGDHRKRSRNAQIDMEYDVMLLGHWHSYMHLTRLIVNGSLKGYDEYAYSSNFGFEVPQQALWVTHPKYGITFRSPVYVDRRRKASKADWVSWPKK